MADIKTILRELSVIFGFIISKYKIAITTIDVETFINLIRQYCINIDECDSEIEKIKQLQDFKSYESIIENGVKLGGLIYDKLSFEGDISWVGSKVKSQYPFDIMIGDKGIALKEDSFILKNPSFADYLNALVQPKKEFKNVHVFRKFANKEFNNWFEYALTKLKESAKEYESNRIIFSYLKKGFYIKKGEKSLLFGNQNKEIEIRFEDNIDEISFNTFLGGNILEHTFSKWIKEVLEKNDEEYTRLKKQCSVKAGENLKQFINENLNIDEQKILELLQIYDVPYYYGKSYGELHLYEVPANDECKVKLIDVEIKVPYSQLNVYLTFEISNENGLNNVVFRVECRYSHGQFKGIPEAKLYYTDNKNHLKNLYKVLD